MQFFLQGSPNKKQAQLVMSSHKVVRNHGIPCYLKQFLTHQNSAFPTNPGRLP